MSASVRSSSAAKNGRSRSSLNGITKMKYTTSAHSHRIRYNGGQSSCPGEELSCMRRVLWLLLAAVLISACDQAPIAALPTSPPSPPTAAPTTMVDRSTTTAAVPTSIPPAAAPTTESDQSTPTAAPTSIPPTAVAGAPTVGAKPSAAPTSEPAAPQPSVALNPQDQAAALLPDFQGDLAGAGKWNRYTISAMIDPAADMIAGREQVEYTNRDDRPLDAVYFHLYPNLPDFGGQLKVSAVAI